MKIAVISYGENELVKLLSNYADIELFSPDTKENIENFDAYAVLGGGKDEPLYLPIDTRIAIEKARADKKPVFVEWCSGIGYLVSTGEIPTVSGRMVYVGDDNTYLQKGNLMDDHDNRYIKYRGFEEESAPILAYAGHVTKHDSIDGETLEYDKEFWALWKYDSSTMICSFRFCNYISARMAPHSRWDGVAGIIISHLTGEKVKVKTEPIISMDNVPKTASETFSEGLKWFDGIGIYIDEGNSGVLEGLMHNIRPDGTQAYAKNVRNDCAGEVGGACFFDWYLNKNKKSYDRFKNLQNFCFNKLYEDKGNHRGLMRWSLAAWGTCYQDDVARTILGTLLSMELTEDREYLDKVCTALDYLLKSTGTDGLRVSNTEAQTLTDEKMKDLSQRPSRFTCAHFNGYYMAVLLLAYKLCGKQEYFDTALKGIETLMSVFPDTIREHSETQELCRLILPLSCLYSITGDEKHREYLYTVAQRLEGYRHKNGGYIEYDTGYRAFRSRTSGTESSLLADNGDPVCDLLYSVNWLPLGFAYAYKATGDNAFKERWQSLVSFLSSVQIKSENPINNGCWCRGIDLDRRESYGMPHDVGWGTCAVESGWTVAEILMGIAFGITLEMDK